MGDKAFPNCPAPTNADDGFMKNTLQERFPNITVCKIDVFLSWNKILFELKKMKTNLTSNY